MPTLSLDVVRLLRNAGSSPVNLSGQDLRGLRLDGKKDQVNLVEADLTGANLCGATLLHMNLYRAKLRETNLSHATLIDCCLIESEGIQSDFSYVTFLDGVFFNSGNYAGSNFTGAMSRTLLTLDATNLSVVSFKDARLYNVSARHTSFVKARFDNAELVLDAPHADMTGASFRGTHIIESTLDEAILVDADMFGASFRGVTAPRIQLSYAVLQKEWESWLPQQSGTVLCDLELCLSWHDFKHVSMHLLAHETDLPNVLAFLAIKKKVAMNALASWFYDALYDED